MTRVEGFGGWADKEAGIEPPVAGAKTAKEFYNRCRNRVQVGFIGIFVYIDPIAVTE